MTVLLDLPPELLLRIFSYVGAEFFHEDMRRLCISKQWYSSAWETFASYVRLTAAPLARLALEDHAPTDGGGASLGLRAAFAPYERVLAQVDIEILGFEGVESEEDGDADADADADEAPRYEDEDGEVMAPSAATEPSQLTRALTQLADVLTRCSGLRHVRLRTGPDLTKYAWQGKAPILWTQPLAGILSLQHLTSLDFDTAGSLPMNAPGQLKEPVHLCDAISALLPNLYRLRCRMDDICASILDVPACCQVSEAGDETAARPGRKLKLKHLIINLSISELSKTISLYRYPRTCNQTVGWQFRRLLEAMEGKAAQLAKHLDKPEMVRIVSHLYPSLVTVAYDAITGKRYLLRSKEAWDAPGLPMKSGEGGSSGGGDQQSEEDEYDEYDMADLDDSDSSDDDDVSEDGDDNGVERTAECREQRAEMQRSKDGD